jgi:hypothetical protein
MIPQAASLFKSLKTNAVGRDADTRRSFHWRSAKSFNIKQLVPGKTGSLAAPPAMSRSLPNETLRTRCRYSTEKSYT